jgi:hypothetical protein
MSAAQPPKDTTRFWRWLSFSILAGFTLANLYLLLFAAPKFDQIYQDALPGRPLPLATEVILGGRIIFAMLNVLWLLFCSYSMHSKSPRWTFFINVATAANGLQSIVTVIALSCRWWERSQA